MPESSSSPPPFRAFIYNFFTIRFKGLFFIHFERRTPNFFWGNSQYICYPGPIQPIIGSALGGILFPDTFFKIQFFWPENTLFPVFLSFFISSILLLKSSSYVLGRGTFGKSPA